MDVALALLIISASVLLIAVYLDSGTDGYDEDRVDRTAETLSATTISVTYDTSPIQDSDHFEEPEAPTSYERSTHGPAANLLGEAAVTNATFGGETLIIYNESFTEGVDANIQGSFVGANHEVYAVASWEPYADGAIQGTATTGTRPPVTDDTSSASYTVSSGMPSIDEEAVASAYATEQDNNPSVLATEEIAEPIAESIVAGYFPPEETQLALERQQLDRPLLVAHYLRMAEILGTDEPDMDELERTDADAKSANEALIDALTVEIALDIEDGPIGDELERIVEDYDMQGTISSDVDDELITLFEETLAPDRVEISVQTWEP